jgi:hypothetical protein
MDNAQSYSKNGTCDSLGNKQRNKTKTKISGSHFRLKPVGAGAEENRIVMVSLECQLDWIEKCLED